MGHWSLFQICYEHKRDSSLQLAFHEYLSPQWCLLYHSDPCPQRGPSWASPQLNLQNWTQFLIYIGFSRTRSGALVFPSLLEFSSFLWSQFLYSHLFNNIPQFVVIHTVKGVGIVNKADIDVFLEPLGFSMIQQMLAIWSLVPLPFLKPAWTSGSSWFTYCWSLAWRILSITILACEVSVIVQ